MKLKKLTVILLLVICFIPVQVIHAQNSKTTTTKSSTTKKVVPKEATKPDTMPKVSTSNFDSITNIGKTVEANTPAFLSKAIISTVNVLEEFRLGLFNNKLIFYPLLAFLAFFILRYIWRMIY